MSNINLNTKGGEIMGLAIGMGAALCGCIVGLMLIEIGVIK